MCGDGLRLAAILVLTNHCFICAFFFGIQPGVPNDNPNDNETITKKSQNPYRPDTGPFAR